MKKGYEGLTKLIEKGRGNFFMGRRKRRVGERNDDGGGQDIGKQYGTKE
jgi:hypothetical protein